MTTYQRLVRTYFSAVYLLSYIYIYFNTSYFHELVHHLTGEGSARSATLATTSISTDWGWGAHTCIYIYVYIAFFWHHKQLCYFPSGIHVHHHAITRLAGEAATGAKLKRRKRKKAGFIIFIFWDWFKFLTWQVKATQSLQAHPLPPPPQHEAPMHTYTHTHIYIYTDMYIHIYRKKKLVQIPYLTGKCIATAAIIATATTSSDWGTCTCIYIYTLYIYTLYIYTYYIYTYIYTHIYIYMV